MFHSNEDKGILIKPPVKSDYDLAQCYILSLTNVAEKIKIAEKIAWQIILKGLDKYLNSEEKLIKSIYEVFSFHKGEIKVLRKINKCKSVTN